MKQKLYVTSQYLKNARQSGQIDSGQLVSAIEHYIAQYKKLKPLFKAADRARIMQRLVDDFINKNVEHESFKRVNCKKGCAFCCHQNVDITFDEAMLLVTTAQIDWMAVEAQAKIESQRSKRCVFLQPDNSCGVYDNRPISCRKYLVVSDPSMCDINNPENTGDVEVLGLRDPEVIASSVMTASDCGPMATMLLKARSKV